MGFFGPSKGEVWTELCREIGAEFVKGGFWKGDRVEARVGEWTLVLDTYTVSDGKTSHTFTRMRAPYCNPDGFRFKIYRKGLFSELGKLFGMQDIEIGDPEFDRDFIIKGNDEAKVRELFAAQGIRELIQAQPSIHLEVKDDEGAFRGRFPEGVDELYFQVHGVLKDLERLKDLYHLFGEVLNQLCKMGSAYNQDPGVSV
ncbi:MAG TPA: DUF3137 domain-containing protein [Bacillota bacterium]|nr:DUF3137 domain-containing protein [Bacillota bacterium]